MADVTSDPAADATPQESVSWRELAVSRSLDLARTRAETRVQRFMAAALELINDNDGKDFTVQEVVERSGQSLRSFYQHFGGKHELLLALFEESVLSTVQYLHERVDGLSDPLERLHTFVIEYHMACRPPASGGSSATGVPPVMAEFAQQLLTQRPKEAASAFGPLVSMFRELLDQAAGAAPSGATCRHAGWPVSCSRRSCSTPSRRRSAAPRPGATSTPLPRSCGT
jgi:AcrR family transcriptional regulator